MNDVIPSIIFFNTIIFCGAKKKIASVCPSVKINPRVLRRLNALKSITDKTMKFLVYFASYFTAQYEIKY